MTAPTISKNSDDWNTQGSKNTNIERVMDDATYSSAHPDDTLVIAGPPRLSAAEASGGYSNLQAVGMLQNISVNQQKPFQPLMAIGSSRSFFVGGKAQGSAQIQRLFMNTSNLLRRLYENNIQAGITSGNDLLSSSLSTTDNEPGAPANPNYLINLDSEFFLVPFGLGVLFKNKARGGIGGFYMELCVIPNFSVSIQAGQSMIMEGCSLFFDRVIPLEVSASGSLLDAYKSIISNDVPADQVTV